MSALACLCGADKPKWAVSCRKCWRLVPRSIQLKIDETKQGRKGSPQHLQAIREARAAIREHLTTP